MNKLLLILLTLVASCGIGKKGDKDNHDDPTPPTTAAVLTDFRQIKGSGIPVVQYLVHDTKGVLEDVLFYDTVISTTTWLDFHTTYPGPGRLIGALYTNGHPECALYLWFRLQLPGNVKAEYELELYRTGDIFQGYETTKVGEKEGRLAVTFHAQ